MDMWVDATLVPANVDPNEGYEYAKARIDM